MCTLRPVLLTTAFVAVALVTRPVSAQSGPVITDLTAGARIRITVLSTSTSKGKPKTISGTAHIVRADADSIAYRTERTNGLTTVPWWQVEELDVVVGTRPYTALERLGAAAGLTALGTALSYTWWHSCNDPESDVIWSCIVAPRRLGNAVRFGAWAGLAIGTGFALALRYEEQWSSVIRAEGPTLLIDHQPQSGFRLGVNFRF